MTKKLILLCETDAGFPTVVIVIFEISNVGLLICVFMHRSEADCECRTQRKRAV
jgi:hypothetical protein